MFIIHEVGSVAPNAIPVVFRSVYGSVKLDKSKRMTVLNLVFHLYDRTFEREKAGTGLSHAQSTITPLFTPSLVSGSCRLFVTAANAKDFNRKVRVHLFMLHNPV